MKFMNFNIASGHRICAFRGRRCDAATPRACCGSGSGPQAAADAAAAHVATAPAIEYAAAWCLGQTVAAAAGDTVVVATAEIAMGRVGSQQVVAAAATNGAAGAGAEDVRGRSRTIKGKTRPM